MNRQRIEAARAAQVKILAERRPGEPFPSLRKLGAYGPQPEKRMVYLSKGRGFAGDPPRAVFNPGFPFVRHGKDFAAGGLPLGFDRKTALEFMREQTR